MFRVYKFNNCFRFLQGKKLIKRFQVPTQASRGQIFKYQNFHKFGKIRQLYTYNPMTVFKCHIFYHRIPRPLQVD
jgi:hypothetical protein